MKKLIIMTVLAVFFSGQIQANIEVIDFSALAKYSLISADVSYLRENSWKFDHWSPKWIYADTKADCLLHLKGASLRLESLLERSPNDIDLVLLLLDVYQYRYNIDDDSILGQFQNLVTASERLFPSDYRPIWSEAVFLSDGGRFIEAVATFQRILNDRNELTTVHPGLLKDYAKTCYLSTMLSTAKISMDRYLKITGYHKEDVLLARMIEEKIKRPVLDSEYGPEEVWQTTRNDSEIRLYSSMLSTTFIIPIDWKARLVGYKNFESICLLTPPEIRSKSGKLITIHFLLIHSTKKQDFEKFISYIEEDFGKGYDFSDIPMPQVVGTKQKSERVRNPNMYKDRSGMSGYMIFRGNPVTEDAGFNMDRPASLPQQDSEKAYFNVSQQFIRFDQDINSVLLVDSCVEIEKETDMLVAEFLRKLSIE